MIIILLISYLFGLDKVSLPLMGVLVAIGLFWFWRQQSTKKKRLNGLKELPGPWGLPLVGNLFQLGKVPANSFRKWSEKYGDIYQVKLGKFQSIIISDAKMSKELFSSSDPAFTGRMHVPEFDVYEEQPGLGLFNSEGELWEVHRRFMLRQLRDFGFGKSSMQALIMDEVNEVLDMLRKKAGKPVTEIRDTLRLAVVNSLWMVMTSQRFSHDDPKLLKLTVNSTKAFNDVIEAGGILVFMPWIKKILPGWSGYTAIRGIMKENKMIFEETVREHKKNFREEELNDFIDIYLAEMKQAGEDTTSHFYGEKAERQLVCTLFDMFLAGSDTTATTIAWSILYLCKFTEVQRKLQDEISEVTGGNTRDVSVDDRPNMPYTQAMLDEVLRFSSLVPDGVQHRCTEDREFRGYFIPKDATIQPNLHFMHHNEKIWGDPENFRPERFLIDDENGDNGRKYMRSPNLQPFMVGRRQCAGETLARDTIFLYLTNIFQKFNIKLDPNQPAPGVEESEIGFLRRPLPYSVIMTQRLDN